MVLLLIAITILPSSTHASNFLFKQSQITTQKNVCRVSTKIWRCVFHFKGTVARRWFWIRTGMSLPIFGPSAASWWRYKTIHKDFHFEQQLSQYIVFQIYFSFLLAFDANISLSRLAVYWWDALPYSWQHRTFGNDRIRNCFSTKHSQKACFWISIKCFVIILFNPWM